MSISISANITVSASFKSYACAILASLTDAAVMIVDNNKSEKKSCEFARDKLMEVDANILGVIVNKIKTSRRSGYYYYYYHYKYHYGNKEK